MEVSKQVEKLINLFEKHGFLLYVIGGAVRDYLLGNNPNEYDLATNATPQEMNEILKDYRLNIFRIALGAVKIKIDDEIFEITTFRKESGVINGRYPKNLTFVKTLQEDVQRRDFTINQLAYHPNYGIVDYLDGLSDLKLKQVRFIGNPVVRVKEDPIRILRALRFSLKLNFELEKNTLNSVLNYAYLVKNLKQIRFMEFYLIFKMPNSKSFIKKYLSVYLDAFPEIIKERLDLLLKKDYDDKLNEYYFFYLFDKNVSYKLLNDLGINSLIKKNVKSFLDYEFIDINLYNTKIQMINYQNDLGLILELLKIIDLNYVNKILKLVDYINDNKMCLSKDELKINYQDLNNLNIPKDKWKVCFNYLLEEVLVNDSLNEYEKLIELLKKKF